MTKERKLLFKIVETWGNAVITSEEREQWLKDYAKEIVIEELQSTLEVLSINPTDMCERIIKQRIKGWQE